MKKLLCLLLSLCLLVGMCSCGKEEKKTAGKCSLSVECKDILPIRDTLPEDARLCVPDSGVFMEKKDIAFYEGETAYDLLVRLAKEEKLSVEFKSSEFGAYIEGVGGLYAFDAGESSGWMYTINGKSASTSADAYTLKDGDKIAFVYVSDFAKLEM